MDAYSFVYLIVFFFYFHWTIPIKKQNKATVINKSKVKHSLVLSACESVPVYSFFFCLFVFINGPEQTELWLRREKEELTEGSYGPTCRDAKIWHVYRKSLWTESAAQQPSHHYYNWCLQPTTCLRNSIPSLHTYSTINDWIRKIQVQNDYIQEDSTSTKGYYSHLGN